MLKYKKSHIVIEIKRVNRKITINSFVFCISFLSFYSGILEKKTNNNGGRIFVTKPNEIAIGVTSIPPAFWIIGNVQSIAVAPVIPIAVERK